MNTKKCLICKKPNDTVYWHTDDDTGAIWCWCNSCGRGYSLRDYCYTAGIELSDFLQGDFNFEHTQPNEVSKLEWPSHFVPLSDPRAEKGVEYIKSRGLELRGDMYYDTDREAIVFPYYYENVFVGAQTRLIKPWRTDEGEVKMLTLPGTRLGLVFYNWNQSPFITGVKGIVLCEGAFNTLALQQALDMVYGGVFKNPWKVVATSGCGSTKHQIDKIKALKEAGYKCICAFDSDEPGLKGLSKLKREDVITHYALVEETDKDWNDILVERGHEGLAKYFLSRIAKI
jgi:DNA primase